MAETMKLLGRGVMADAEAAATVSDGLNAVPVGKRWNAKVIVYNTGASTRTVTCGFATTDVSLTAGAYLLNAESIASKARQEFALRSYEAGYTFRANQGSGVDVQWEVVGWEEDV